jgi:hypothetical protein
MRTNTKILALIGATKAADQAFFGNLYNAYKVTPREDISMPTETLVSTGFPQ